MSGATRIHIVGLGPGSPDHVTLETRALLASGLPVILRTRHHPSAKALAPNAADCDDLYTAGGSFEAVYEAIANRVLERARTSELIFAVPGHPLIAERSVELILAKSNHPRVPTRVYPAISFIDLAATALRRDLGTIQICDATDLRIDPLRPALVHQLFDRDIVSALKLRLLQVFPAEHPALVLSSLGSESESKRPLSLHELDHRAYGHLDTLFVYPLLEPLDDVRRFDGLLHIVRTLLGPDGCPWDREQTHLSLRPYLLEESYEALEAIDSGDLDSLAEELGDVLFQTVIHTAVAENAGEFEMGDVLERITRKLIRRHPHVFADGSARTADEVELKWEQLKQQEKGRESVLEGVPQSLPALAASQAIQSRARKVGFDWPDIEGPLEKLREELAEFARAEGAAERADEFGDILFVLVNVADHLGLDSEQALRGANDKFRRRFGAVERLAAERQLDLRDLDLAGLDSLWDEVKATERAL